MHAMAVPETNVIDKLLNHLMGGRVGDSKQNRLGGAPGKEDPRRKRRNISNSGSGQKLNRSSRRDTVRSLYCRGPLIDLKAKQSTRYKTNNQSNETLSDFFKHHATRARCLPDTRPVNQEVP